MDKSLRIFLLFSPSRAFCIFHSPIFRLATTEVGLLQCWLRRGYGWPATTRRIRGQWCGTWGLVLPSWEALTQDLCIIGKG